MTGVRRLNWGCGSAGEPGWVNSDLKEGPGIDISCDIRDGLPVDDGAFDYVVSVHALPMIPLPDLNAVLRELRRVLRRGGVVRLVLPDLDRGIDAYLRGDKSYFLVDDSAAESWGGKFVTHMLWFGYTTTLFTKDFAEELLWRADFSSVEHVSYMQTASRHGPGILELDNRPDESFYIEAVR